jgi:phosphatidylserine decarboxylase
MLKQLLCYFQYILPQHLLSTLMGKLGDSTTGWVKNSFIDFFCRAYTINLSEAERENPRDYVSFNDFFTRALKPGSRPIDQTVGGIVSPADGTIAQLGNIQQQQLLQAKGMYFNLTTLLGGDKDAAALFHNGSFSTIYLAPHNYHRVHMPLAGRLLRSIYIPGKLFSVNRMTSQLIPNLYARNERLVLLFDTEAGAMAVILVGALIVGSMQTVWMDKPIRSSKIEIAQPTRELYLEKGAELGRFKMGSTVITLLPQNNLRWSSQCIADTPVITGELLATLSLS